MLANGSFQVKVFVGAKQAEGRVPFELLGRHADAGRQRGDVKIVRSGSNAVDMHIAYYVGRLLEKEPHAIDSHHLAATRTSIRSSSTCRPRACKCKRAKSITEIAKPVHAQAARPPPARRVARAAVRRPARKPHSDKLAPIIKQLHSLSRQTRHAQETRADHREYFRHHGGALADTAIEQIIDDLIRMKYVSQSGTKVTYHLA